MDSKLSMASANWADTVEAEEAEFGRVEGPIDRRSAEYSRSPPQVRSPKYQAYPTPAAPALPDHPPFKVYLGNIPYDLDEELIEHFFRGLQLNDIIITRHRDTGRAKGCFVEFATQTDLKNALSLDGTDMLRRPVRVQIAEPRSGGAPSRGGGGGFFDRDRGSRGRYGDDFGDSFGGRPSRGGPGGPRDYRGSGGGSGGGDWNTPGSRGGGGGGRTSSGDYTPSEPLDPGKERPKLVLQPRSTPVESDAAPQQVTSPSAAGKSNPFGGARPTDTAAKLRELEERDRQQKKESETKSAVPGSPSAAAAGEKQQPTQRKDSANSSEAGANGDVGRNTSGGGGGGGRGRGGPVKILTRDNDKSAAGGGRGGGDGPATGPPPGISGNAWGRGGGRGGRGDGDRRSSSGRGGRGDDDVLPHHRQGDDNGGRGSYGGRGRGRSDRGGRGGRSGPATKPEQKGGKPPAKEKAAVVLDEDDVPKTKVSNVFDILGEDE